MKPDINKSIGFTGTRCGINNTIKERLRDLLIKLQVQGFEWFHHGDCVGADADAHDVAKDLGYKIVIHPPISRSLRAFRESEYIEEPDTYMRRNRNIVVSSSILIACPRSDVEEIRSGTWSTVRYAKKCAKATGKPNQILVWADSFI